MVDQVDKHRETERVREQDELLAPVGAHLSDLGEKTNARHQFRFGERLLHGELVDMADDATDQLPQPGIRTLLQALDHLPGQSVCCHVVVHSYPT